MFVTEVGGVIDPAPSVPKRDKPKRPSRREQRGVLRTSKLERNEKEGSLSGGETSVLCVLSAEPGWRELWERREETRSADRKKEHKT